MRQRARDRAAVRKLVRQWARTLIGLVCGVLIPASVFGGEPGTSPDAPWLAAIRAMDDARSRSDVAAALQARQEAYQAALGSRRWDALVDVGDAMLRLAATPGLDAGARRQARRAYLEALFQARRQGSLDGAVRVAEAFAAIGDREVARQAFVVANVLAARSTTTPHASERLRALEARLRANAPLVGGLAGSAPTERHSGTDE